MTWFIEEEITNDQDNKPNWADFKRFERIWFQRQHVNHTNKENNRDPTCK